MGTLGEFNLSDDGLIYKVQWNNNDAHIVHSFKYGENSPIDCCNSIKFY